MAILNVKPQATRGCDSAGALIGRASRSTTEVAEGCGQLDPWVGCDGPSLLAAAAALQLDPANAGAALRLHRLAAVAASVPPAGDAKVISTSALRRALSDDLVSGPAVQMKEDPFEGLYVVEVPFFDRSRLVVQGMATGCGMMAERVLKAIFAKDPNEFPEGFLLRARTLAVFLLDLSDGICRGAGLRAGAVPPKDPRAVAIPSARAIAEKSRLLRFSSDDLFDGMLPEAVDYLLSRIVLEQGSALEWSEDGSVSTTLMIHPLIRSDKDFVVAAPGELATSLRHWLIVEAYEWGCEALLAERLAELATAEASSLLGVLVDDELELVERPHGMIELRGVFDGDKALSVLVLADNLADYDLDSPWGHWGNFDALLHVSADRSADPVHLALRLVITYGIGRDSAFGVPSEEATPTLIAELSDFETIVGAPGTHRLSLWYFATALERMEQQAPVLNFSLLDVFQLYRDHDNSFYLSDSSGPTLVQVEPGYGQQARVDFYRRWGPRFRRDARGRVVREFRPLHGEGTSPILEAWYSRHPICIVDVADAEVWVRGASASTTQHLRTFVEAVAYWTWQIAVSLPGLVPAGDFAIDVDIVGEGTSQVTAIRTDGGLSVEIIVPGVDDEPSEANGTDRLLVRALLDALGASMASVHTDTIAPVGPKTMLHVRNSNRDVLLWPGSLRPATWVDGQVVAQVLDDLGAHLRLERRHAVGSIDDSRRLGVLNKEVVAWYKSELAREFTALDADGLSRWLVEHHESLIHETASETENLPSRIACYGASSDEATRIRRHQRLSVTAMLASRFLIEYSQKVCATGNSRISQARYERLLAIASEIINKGMLSDSIHFGLSDCKLSILRSGRFGINRDEDPYSRAAGAYADLNAGRTLSHAVSEELGEFSAQGPSLLAADPLALAEFGFSYSELAQFCSAVVYSGMDRGIDDVIEVDREELLTEASGRTGLPLAKCARILESLTLSGASVGPDAYWELPNVAPWRYGRSESYLRRPLLRNRDGTTLTAGYRATWYAPQAWFEHFLSGRLQGKSKEMRQALARLRDEKGRAFESFVESQLTALGFTGTQRGVRRLGGLDLRNVDNEDLGDIDVVAIDRRARRVLLLELKDLEIARTPTELEREVRSIFEGPKSAVVRLNKRLQAVSARRAEVLDALGLTNVKERWEFVPCVVVNEPLMSITLREAGVRVLPVSSLSLLTQ